jgi:MFS family permease
MLMANGPALIMTAFPGPERGRALGFQGMVVALGSLAGPAVGGLILEAFGWRFGFYVNAPIVAAGILASLKVLPRPAASAREPLDAAGALLFAAGMLGLLLGLSHGREWGFVSPKTLGCLALAALALPLFAARERRIQTPMIDFALLLHRPFLTGNLAALLSFMALFANAILLPFYLHDELSVAPARIGLVLAVLPLTMSVAAPLSGFLSERRNFALFSGAGLCGSALGLLVQAGLAPDSPLWRVILGQVLLGAGVGLFQSPNNNSVLSSAPPEKSGQAGGILALTRNLGMIGGIALAVFTFETARGLFGEFIFGFRAALGLGSLLALTGAAVSFSRRKDFRRPD